MYIYRLSLYKNKNLNLSTKVILSNKPNINILYKTTKPSVHVT